jgi:hypothetical protein
LLSSTTSFSRCYLLTTDAFLPRPFLEPTASLRGPLCVRGQHVRVSYTWMDEHTGLDACIPRQTPLNVRRHSPSPIEKVVQDIPSPLPLPIIKDARQPSPSSSSPSEQATGTSTFTSVPPLTPHPEGNHGQQMQRELFVSLYSISREEELVINVVHGKTRVESLWKVLYPGGYRARDLSV